MECLTLSESPCHPAAAHTVRQRWRLEHSPTTALVSTVNADISNIVKSRCKKSYHCFIDFLLRLVCSVVGLISLIYVTIHMTLVLTYRCNKIYIFFLNTTNAQTNYEMFVLTSITFLESF